MEHHFLIEDINCVLQEKLNVDQMLGDMDAQKIANLRIQYAADAAESPDEALRQVEQILTQLRTLINEIPPALKKEDRLLVVIKSVKALALYRALHWVSVYDLKTKVAKEFPFLKKINSRNPAFFNFIGPHLSMVNLNATIERISGYLSPDDGSSPIPSVAQYTWDPNKSLYEIYEDLVDIMEEYHNQSKGWITVRGEKLIWRSPDKKTGWFDTGGGSCDREGESMNHCGNSPSTNIDNETLYSFSSIRTMGGEMQRYPHVTLILSDDGVTGEIKGRGNAKPDDKYGEALKEFMLLDIVKGMGPSTWETDSNWKWRDFTESQRDEILDAKPEFDPDSVSSVSIYQRILDGEASDDEALEALENLYIPNNSVLAFSGGEVKLETDYDVLEAMIDTLQDNLENDLESYLIDAVDGTGDTDYSEFLGELVHPLFTTGVTFEEAHEQLFVYMNEHTNWQDSAAMYLKKVIRLGNKHIDAALRIYHKETYDQMKLDLGDTKAANNETFKKLAKEIYPDIDKFRPQVLERRYNDFLKIVFDEMKREIEENTSGVVEIEFDDMPYRNSYLVKYVYLSDQDYYEDYSAEDIITSVLGSDIRDEFWRMATSIPESVELEEALLEMWSIMNPEAPTDYSVGTRDITRLYRTITGKPYPDM